MYTKKDFAQELRGELSKKYNIHHLSRWAHDKYLDHASELDQETYKAIMIVIAMENGPEFEMTEEEFKKFLDEL